MTIGLPDTHCSPASITLHFDESIITGTRAISGSAASRFKNVAIASSGSSSGTAGNIGLGFALPSNLAKRVSAEIIANKKATHGVLGAQVSDAASKSGSTQVGAYLEKIVSGGAAEKGGLKQGDVVTEFNGVRVTDASDLTAQVRAAAGGSDATVKVVRDGKTETYKVTLGTL